MRVAFEPPSAKELLVLFLVSSRRGRGLDNIQIFKPPRIHQRGAGLFSFISGLVKRATPLTMRTVALDALEFGKNVIEDVSSRKSNFKKALKQRGKQSPKGAGHKLAKKVERKLRKGGKLYFL